MNTFFMLGPQLSTWSSDTVAQLASRLGLHDHQRPAVERALRDPEGLAQRVRQLSTRGQESLRGWVRRRGLWGLSPHDAVANAGPGLPELEAAGLLFYLDHPMGSVPTLPGDWFGPLLDTLWKIPWDTLSEPAPSAQDTKTVSHWIPLWQNLFVVINFCRYEPILLTTQWRPYRRHVAKIGKRLHLPDALAVDEYFPNLEWLLRQLGIFTVVDYPLRYHVHDAQLEQAVAQGSLIFWDRAAQHLFNPAAHYGPHLLLWTLAGLLPPDRVLRVNELARWMDQAGLGAGTNATRYYVNQSLRFLAGFGLWETTGSGLGRLTPVARACYERRLEAEAPRRAAVQASGEILLPPDTAMADRVRVDQVARLVHADQVTRYRIDQDSLKEVVRRGVTSDEVIERLRAVSRDDLPQALVSNIHDWSRALSRHRLMEVTVVHSHQAHDSRQVQAVLGTLAVGRLSDTDVIVRQDQVAEVIKRLERSGMPILGDIERPSAPVKPASPELETPGPLDPPIRVAARPRSPTPPTVSVDQVVQWFQSGQPARVLYRLPNGRPAPEQIMVPLGLKASYVEVMTTASPDIVQLPFSAIIAIRVL
jgi:hypothetical protein